jgi:hypothetical protein
VQEKEQEGTKREEILSAIRPRLYTVRGKGIYFDVMDVGVRVNVGLSSLMMTVYGDHLAWPLVDGVVL